MSRLFLRQLAELSSEPVELYWIAGFYEDRNAWYVRAVMRNVVSNRYKMVSLPIGLAPLLSLGNVFSQGEMLSLSARGIVSRVTVLDVSDCHEVTSADVNPGLYSFDGNSGGIQRLLLYSTSQGDILIPAVELIRYLFLHNRTLANALMRPGEINLLFHPEVPGFRRKLLLRFTSQMPNNCLSRDFVKEFAWIAIDPDARRSWDSVHLKSLGKQYVTFNPPPLKNSVWTFRGVQYGNQWLVLELLHLTGKNHPCEELHYGHPSMRETVRNPSENSEGQDLIPDGENGDPSDDRITYDYELVDGQDGAKGGSQKIADSYSKLSDFEYPITVDKLLIPLEGSRSRPTTTTDASIAPRTEVRKTIKVSLGQRSLGAKLPPLEFKLLTPAVWDCIGDLEALANTVGHMANRVPWVDFAMSLCQLKAGRVFSIANRKPRVALLVTIRQTDAPPIVLLDVERTGDVALSLVAMRFKDHSAFNVLEYSAKRVLDGLVDASGHWDHEIERELSDVCACERLPKMLTPRNKASVRGQTVLWAMKLLHRLGLEDGFRHLKSR